MYSFYKKTWILILLILCLNGCTKNKNIPTANTTPSEAIKTTSVVPNKIEPAQLIGYWTGDPTNVQEYTERYVFYEDGTFEYGRSERERESRERFYIGTWAITGDTVTLTKTGKVTLEGGELVDTEDDFITTPKQLIYTEPVFTGLDPGEVIEISVDAPTNISADAPQLMINGTPYWQTEDTEYFLEGFKSVVAKQSNTMEMPKHIYENTLAFLTTYPELFYTPKQDALRSEKLFENTNMGVAHGNFDLYDFEEDGIPEILVFTGFYEGGSADLYKWIDNEYQNIAHTDNSVSFYKDGQNRIVIVEGDEAYCPAITYSYLTFENGDYKRSYLYYSDYFAKLNLTGKEIASPYDIYPNPSIVDDSLVPFQPKYSKQLMEDGRKIVQEQIQRATDDHFILLYDGKIVSLHDPLPSGIPGTFSNLVYDYGDDYAIPVWIPELKTMFLSSDTVGDYLFQTTDALKSYADYYWGADDYKETAVQNNFIYEGSILYFDYSENGSPYIGINVTKGSQYFTTVELHSYFRMLNKNYGEFDFYDDDNGYAGLGQVYFEKDQIRVNIQMTKFGKENPYTTFNPWPAFADDVTFKRINVSASNDHLKQSQYHSIVINGVLLGSVLADKWLSPQEVYASLPERERYDVYIDNKRTDKDVGKKIAQKAESLWTYGSTVKLNKYAISSIMVSPVLMAVSENMPIHFPKQTPLKNPEYLQFVQEYAQSLGYSDLVFEIPQIIQVDMDGDGVNEVLLNAKTNTGANDPTWNRGVVFMRKIVNGTVQNIALDDMIGEATPYPGDFLEAHSIRQICDLNHDGTAEIIMYTVHGNDEYVAVYELQDLEFVRVLYAPIKTLTKTNAD